MTEPTSVSEPAPSIPPEPTEPPEPFRPDRTTYYELHLRVAFAQVKKGDLLTAQARDAVAVPASLEVLRSTVRRWPSPAPASKDWELVSLDFDPTTGLRASIRATKDAPERPVVCVYAKSTYAQPEAVKEGQP